MTGRRSDADALKTRERIVRRAVDVATVDGLDGLSIGQLAKDLGMSKAGVIGHFGTKQELQLASIDLGREIFREHVWYPVRDLEPGLPRLLAMCDTWARYGTSGMFPGGCFVAAVTQEFKSRPGRVHDKLDEGKFVWRGRLANDVQIAIDKGELPESLDPEQTAFTLWAVAIATATDAPEPGPEAAQRCLNAMHTVLGISPEHSIAA